MAMCGGTGDLFSIFAFDYFPFHYPPSPLAREIRFSCARRRDVRRRFPSIYVAFPALSGPAEMDPA